MSYAIAPQNKITVALETFNGRRVLFILTAIAIGLAFLVVVLGAFTRLQDAGLGCPDWPGCYGHITWPSSAQDVSAAEARFPDAPVEHDKTWPEMVHRYFAGGLGLLILAIAILSVYWQSQKHDHSISMSARLPQKLPIFLVALVVLQAAFGMWTVTLKLWPQVVTAHLLGGFATLSFLCLLMQRLSRWRWTVRAQQKLVGKQLALLVLIVVVLQIALGGWTTSNYAAMACPDLPTCHGKWWPQADFIQGFNVLQHVGPNYLGGLLDNHARTAIHLTHRMGAIVVALLVIGLALRLWFFSSTQCRPLVVILLTALFVQICLGLSNVYWVLPLPVAVAHNACGAFLLMVLVTINHRLRTAKFQPVEK